MTEDEMVGWHHWLKGHESEQALEDGEEKGSLVCCSPWGYKESDMTERLNWTDESLRWPLPPVAGCVNWVANLLFSVTTRMNSLCLISGWLGEVFTSALTVSPCTFLSRKWLLSLSLANQSLPALNFSSAASAPVSAFAELRRVRALLWVRLWLKEML